MVAFGRTPAFGPKVHVRTWPRTGHVCSRGQEPPECFAKALAGEDEGEGDRTRVRPAGGQVRAPDSPGEAGPAPADQQGKGLTMRQAFATLALVVTAASAAPDALAQIKRPDVAPARVRSEMRAMLDPGLWPEARQTWTMAFVLLTYPETDITTGAFAAKVAKVEHMRRRVGREFRKATEGLGAMAPSAEVFVLQPERPIPCIRVRHGDGLYEFAQRVAGMLYARTDDEWDFIAIYEDYPEEHVNSRHLFAQSQDVRTGMHRFDATARFGSEGRLLSVGLIKDVNEMPATYDYVESGMQLLLHETVGHHFGVYREELSPERIHFEAGIEGPTFTMMYARPWVRIDDTHFTTAEVRDPETGHFVVTYHPWLMYLMGLKRRGEVPSRIMKVDPDTRPSHRYDLVTTTGTFEWIYFEDLFPMRFVAEVPARPRAVPWNRLLRLIRPRPIPKHERLPP